MLEGIETTILDGNHRNRDKPIQKCHDAALKNGYTVFAIKDGGACFSSADAKTTYKKYGSSTDCSSWQDYYPGDHYNHYSVGRIGILVNSVYEISKLSLTLKWSLVLMKF